MDASNPPALIGISGKQYAGKDELARWLLQQFPQACQTPIAGAIKAAYTQQHGLTFTELETHKATHRPGLIALGNWGRAQNKNYWLRQVLEDSDNSPAIKIISDVRLPHEADALRQAGAYLVRVEASREVRATRGRLVSEDDPTECALDDYAHWDAVVENNGEREALYQQAQGLLPEILQRFGLH